jgi:predicted CopG family antitoxin
MSQLTITLDDNVKKKLHLLAKKRNSTVSKLINELINEESKKIKMKTPAKGLGTYLSELPLTPIPDFKNEKEMLGKLKEEKHLRQA